LPDIVAIPRPFEVTVAKGGRPSRAEETEAKEPEKPATVEELLSLLVVNSGPERTLGLMLQIINSAEARGEDMSLGVTLIVGGRLMTGELIGYKKYYKEFGRLWPKAMAEAADEERSLADTFAMMGEDLTKDLHEATERLGWEDPRLTPAWINVQNMRVLYPPPGLTMNGPFRIRVSAIDALTLGSPTVAT
jgi:hypothetical protein